MQAIDNETARPETEAQRAARAEKELRACIKQTNPEAQFTKIPKIGLIALGAASYEDFLSFLNESSSSSSDRTLVQEQLVIDGLLYPDDPDAKKRVRRVLRSMPFLLGKAKLHSVVEECSRKGEVGDLKLSDEERTELSGRNEFGFDGISTPLGNIIVTTNENSAPLVRVVLNEVQGRRHEVGTKIVAAILASLEDLSKRDIVEAEIRERPGIIPPLWIAVQSLTGDAELTIEKN